MTDIKMLLSIVSSLSQENKKSLQHNKKLVVFHSTSVCNDSSYRQIGGYKKDGFLLYN